MIEYKIVLAISDGLIFSFFALGLYIAFIWMKFPDLTPDGSFVIGACVYAKCVIIGLSPILGIFLSILSGFVAGAITSILNQKIKIPAFISGLLMASSLYSINWLILGKPNQYIENYQTLISNYYSGKEYAYILISILLILLFSCIYVLHVFGNSIWGLRLRAIGENNKLANDMKVSKFLYYLVGLGIANAFVALSGALFVQRTYSADINMGTGQTISVLIGLMLGIIFSGKFKSLIKIFLTITFGTIIYKIMIWLTLEAGFPPEVFKLTSSFFLISIFIFIINLKINILSDLRWS